MRLLIRHKKLISALVGGFLLSYSLLGMFQCNKSVNHKLSMLSSTSILFSTTSMIIGSIKKSIAAINTSKVPAPVKPLKNKKGRFSSILLFLLTSVIIIQDKSLIFMLLLAVIGFVKVFCDKNLIHDNRMLQARVKFYRWWSLKFLTPLQKCIINRADEYDLNPMSLIGRVEYVNTPYFVLCEQSAGCFFVYRHLVKS
jgi:hypothetical protein